MITVFTGSELQSLSLISSNTHLICYEHLDCGCHWRQRPEITFHVLSGQTYQIVADSPVITDASMQFQSVPFPFTNSLGSNSVAYVHYWGPTFSTNVANLANFSFRLQFITSPLNDDFENRLPLTGSRTHISVSNAGANKQPGEPDHAQNRGGSSIWYSWNAPASGRVTLSTSEIAPYPPPSSSGGTISTTLGPPTCGDPIDQNPLPAFFPVFAAYTGQTLNSLQPANCLPLSLPAYSNAVCFDVDKGQTYQIAFDGNKGTAGDITLYLALTEPAINDPFERRIRLHGIQVLATGYNAGATHEDGEPTISMSSGDRTVWWSWRAPVPGTVSVELTGSDHSFPFAVFTGPTVTRLEQVAAGIDSLSFDATEGETYQIAVSDAAGLTGSIVMALHGPVVEATLESVVHRFRNAARLRYRARPGHKLLLLRSSDAVEWQSVKTGVAHGQFVDFLVPKVPTSQGPYYRAIIYDLVGGSSGSFHGFSRNLKLTPPQ
jgi:hypothetical protein